MFTTPVYTQQLLPKRKNNRMKKEKNGISSKWIIQGFDGYVIGSDGNLYKLPFESKSRYYGLRMIKEQPGKRYKINGVWWSKRQLKNKIRLNPSPETLIEDKNNYPF